MRKNSLTSLHILSNPLSLIRHLGGKWVEQKTSAYDDANHNDFFVLSLGTFFCPFFHWWELKRTFLIFSYCLYRLCTGTQTHNNPVDDLDYDDDDEDFTVDHKSVNSWFKRIMRVALPVQFFLMVMLFFAWNSTDHHPHHGFFHSGCNGVSRFHFLYPELKYINGPPPI